MKLSVIIPYYKTLDLLKKYLLKSIQGQDFDKNEYEVIIVDDCSPISLTMEDLDEFKDLNIQILKTPENFGPGVARQYGIMHAQGEFLTFCDADDYLSRKDTFSTYINTIEDNDILVTTFIEETRFKDEDGKTILLPHDHDRTWMHGKVYRKAFIDDKKIMFHPLLRANEDGYFNNISFSETDKIAYIDDYFSYIWKNNSNSITRSNDQEYNYSGYHEFIYGTRLACLELYKRKNMHYVDVFLNTAGLVYYTFQSDLDNWKKHNEYYKMAKKEFIDLYNQFGDLYNHITEQDYYDSMMAARNQAYRMQAFVEKKSYKDFIRSLNLKTYSIL